MNNENPIAPVNIRVHKLKAKLRPENFEERSKFKEMNLSHSLELAKTKAKMHNMGQGLAGLNRPAMMPGMNLRGFGQKK